MPMAGWWPSAWRSSCRCRAVQSGRHPCSVDRPKKRVHSRHSPRLAAAARGTCAACARRLTSRIDTSSVDTTTLAAGAGGLAAGTGASRCERERDETGGLAAGTGASRCERERDETGGLAAGTGAAGAGALAAGAGAHDGAMGTAVGALGMEGSATGIGGCANGGGGGAIDGGGGAIDGGPMCGATDGS